VEAEFKVTYTPRIVKIAARRFWLRFIGPDGLIAFAVVCVLGVVLWATGSSLGYVALLVMPAVGILACTVYVIYQRRAIEGLKRLSPPAITYRLDDEEFTALSPLAESHVKWAAAHKLWRFADVWLLFFSARQYLTLPTADLSDDVRDFIVRKVQEAGGKVR